MSKFTGCRNETRGDRIWIEALCRTCITAVILLGAIAVFAMLPGKALAEARVHADFNGDGFDDLAIGVPEEDIGNLDDAGAVNVIYGSASGLTATGDQFWHQDSPGLVGVAEENDFFGRSLTAGDFDGDGFDDLAVGVPGETNEIANISSPGAVNVIYGSAGGLTATGDQFWNQDSPGILNLVEPDDGFGSSLTAGDFDGDGFDDLAVGVRDESISLSVGGIGGASFHSGVVGSIDLAGAVNVIYGSASGLTATGDQFWHQNSSGILDTAEESDSFGFSLPQ